MMTIAMPALADSGESFTSVAGAGDEITPQAFQAETEVLLRLMEIGMNSKTGVEKIPKRPLTKSTIQECADHSGSVPG